MRRLVETLTAVESTSSKLQKVDALAAYLASLSDDDLRIATTYLTGRPFAPGDLRRLNVGGSALTGLILEVSGRGSREMSAAYLKYGDAGDVARELLRTRRHAGLFAADRLTLTRVQRDFERVAAAEGKGSRAVKAAVLRALLADADPDEARFLVRIVTGDLRIGLREGLLEDAIARAFAAPSEAVRRANMLQSDVGEVAVLARHGRLDEAHLRLFHPFRFMLAEVIFSAGEAFAATRGDGAAPEALLAEDKYDGVRAQVHCADGHAAIYSRTLDDVTYAYPDLVPDLLRLDSRCILDGEIVAWQHGRAMPFVRLQLRLRRKDPGALVDEIPVVFVAFDLVHQDGDDLLERPLAERRARLERLPFGGRAALSRATLERTPDDLARRFAEARDRVNEGLVIKRLDGRYQVGRRGRLWVKWKEELDTLDVVVVAVEHGNGKRAGVLSDYTFAVRDGERLATIGKAYSGLTDAEIAELTAWFRAHTLDDRGWVRIVEPRVVLEVAFDQIHRSDRHDSGYALRFPRIKAIRHDKRPDEISTLDDVRAIVARLEAGTLRRTREARDGTR